MLDLVFGTLRIFNFAQAFTFAVAMKTYLDSRQTISNMLVEIYSKA